MFSTPQAMVTWRRCLKAENCSASSSRWLAFRSRSSSSPLSLNASVFLQKSSFSSFAFESRTRSGEASGNRAGFAFLALSIPVDVASNFRGFDLKAADFC